MTLKKPFYKEYFEWVPDAIVVTDPKGKITYVNSHALEMFGYKVWEIVGKHLETLLPQRYRSSHKNHRKEYAANPRSRPMGAGLELYGLRADGTEFPVDIMLSPMDLEDTGSVIAVVRDVSDRKRVENELLRAREELEQRVQKRTMELAQVNESLRAQIIERERAERNLRESEERYRSLVETAGSAIICLSPEHKILEWNREAERISGYAREEVLGRDYLELFIPKDARRELAADIRKVLAGEPTRAYENIFLTRNGAELDMLWNVNRLQRGAEDPPGIIAIGQDITPRKQAEKEKRRLEEQIHQSQKMEALGRLAGGVVHDINNLLTGVMAFSELLLDELPKDSPLYEGAEEARKSCARSALLTRQLLAISRRQPLETHVINLNAVIMDMNQMLRSLIAEDIEIQCTLDSDLGFVKADPGRIEQVILNLALNARDAMQEGGKLTIETANFDVGNADPGKYLDLAPGPYVLLTVNDTGSGMDDETIAHIFEPFYTTKEKGKGTGLGLTTVYGNVKQNGGSISVFSEPGKGSTFNIYLPRADGSPSKTEAGRTEEEHPPGSETILLVEDDNTVRITTSKILRGYGYHVLEARNGQEALNLCRSYPDLIDLVLTDVVMPRMNGPELAAHLANLRPDTKLIYMSAHMDTALDDRGFLPGGFPFLEKPFTRMDLVRKVRQVLGSQISDEI